MKKLIICGLLLLMFGQGCSSRERTENKTTSRIKSDVCVYGASGPGIAAAVAAAREGYSVIIVEPCHKIGGLLGSGFRMQQDVPYADHLGGLTGAFYATDIVQPQPRHQQGAGKYNIKALQSMIDEYKDQIKVITDHRLSSVKKSNGSLKEVFFEYAPPGKDGVPISYRISEDLVCVSSSIFIDASYEGDLMAFSGVPYRVGKESKKEYGESLAGTVLSKRFPGVDPYKEKGNPQSGFLSCITPDPLGEEGDSSRFFMAYNFKLAWEKNPTPEHPGILITPPENKDPDVYELLKRYVDAGYSFTWPHENFSRGELMTGTLPGMQIDYPDGDWPTRSKVWQGFIDHIKTLTDFSGKEVRLVSDCNEDTDGWPFLYIRGGRRMVGEYVMTQHDLQLQTDPPTPIGLGYYKVDIYPNRLVVLDDGTLAHEGNLWEHVSPGPYQIPYGAIIPKKKDCRNLLVPLCMSASHIAYSSIRMEATYMVMGESAGIAAAIAIRENKAVQDISRSDLTSMLKKYGQKLEWDGKGYRNWRYNIFSTPQEEVTRWDTHPEEYQKKPVETLWK
ncbi:putative secreted protein [Proteiniphilum saccharofermentans]|uniref:Putative secreted protein n=1 Tax=Proteiniphilum saccharofermentans TaxID=1642647 RepID=A0A1R3SRB4_9BACT|nr:FAD-dependent oxidoreductase [Proteiniphilum saccharofermentans]SCD18943.1 putative secreted protein [Proteiniphilum saccharofermentans]